MPNVIPFIKSLLQGGKHVAIQTGGRLSALKPVIQKGLSDGLGSVKTQMGHGVDYIKPLLRENLTKGYNTYKLTAAQMPMYASHLGELVASPVGRNVIAGTGGYVAGSLGAQQLPDIIYGRHIPVADDTAAMVGGTTALAALSLVNPNLRKHLAYAARVQPGNKWSYIKAPYNFMTKPQYPIIEPYLTAKFPKVAPKTFNVVRKIPSGALAIGGTIGIGNAAIMLPKQMVNTAIEMGVDDPAVLDKIWLESLLYDNPQVLYSMFAPKSWGGDSTSIGDLHRDSVLKVLKPEISFNLSRGRNEFPTAFAIADSLKQHTPFGFLTTYLLNKYRSHGYSPANKNFANLLGEYKNKIVNDPELLDSPLLNIYKRRLLQDKVLENPGFQRQLGGTVLSTLLKPYAYVAPKAYAENKYKTESAELKPFKNPIIPVIAHNLLSAKTHRFKHSSPFQLYRNLGALNSFLKGKKFPYKQDRATVTYFIEGILSNVPDDIKKDVRKKIFEGKELFPTEQELREKFYNNPYYAGYTKEQKNKSYSVLGIDPNKLYVSPSQAITAVPRRLTGIPLSILLKEVRDSVGTPSYGIYNESTKIPFTNYAIKLPNIKSDNQSKFTDDIKTLLKLKVTKKQLLQELTNKEKQFREMKSDYVY